MAPRELILGISKGRMDKLKGGSYGHTVPVKLRGAGGEIIGGCYPSPVRSTVECWARLERRVPERTGRKLPSQSRVLRHHFPCLRGPKWHPSLPVLPRTLAVGKKRRKATARKAKKTTGVAAEIAKISTWTRKGTPKRARRLHRLGVSWRVRARKNEKGQKYHW